MATRQRHHPTPALAATTETWRCSTRHEQLPHVTERCGGVLAAPAPLAASEERVGDGDVGWWVGVGCSPRRPADAYLGLPGGRKR